MITLVRRAAALCVLGAALAACGTSGPAQAPRPASGTPSAA
ncbi:polysaccharide deacetylase, partial [Streptomyces sp. SID5606]|nr:polysaccharide deacetylase [Streptomyces sp. SID5606]